MTIFSQQHLLSHLDIDGSCQPLTTPSFCLCNLSKIDFALLRDTILPFAFFNRSILRVCLPSKNNADPRLFCVEAQDNGIFSGLLTSEQIPGEFFSKNNLKNPEISP